MFGIIDMIICFVIASVLSSFVCMFMCGAQILNREGEAYQEGSYKGFEDGMSEGLTQGQNDAWEFWEKVWELKLQGRDEVFGYSSIGEILDHFTPQEALAKLKAYEEAQSKIEVGDVVEVDGTFYTYVVTVIQEESDGTYYCGLSKNGRWFAQNNVTKIGKHIDIKSILEQIGE